MKHTFILLATLAVVSACSKKEEGYKPELKPLTEAVYASGNLKPRNEHKEFSTADGVIVKKLVREGDTVKKGTPLYVIESDQTGIRQRNASEAYKLAKINSGDDSPVLAELQSALEASKAKMLNDSVNFTRYKNLWASQATSKAELDRATLAYTLSKQDYQAQLSRWEKTKNQLSLELENAKSQYGLAADEYQNFTITSRYDGTVYETYKEEGEAIRRNEPLALLGSSTDFYVKLSVDELDIQKLKTGQKIILNIDVFKGKTFDGVISKIYPSLDQKEQSFWVDADFVGEKPQTYAGLTVEANIIVSQKEKALVVPKSLLYHIDTLWVKRNDDAVKIKIKKGIENYDWVEILDGLDTADRVLKRK